MDNKNIVYGVMLPPTHRGPKYLNALYSDVHFTTNISPMLADLKGTSTLNALERHGIAQNSRHARFLPDSAMWTDAEHGNMQCISANKVIGRIAPFLPDAVIVTTCIFLHAIR